jgi:hypothetical protein
MPIVPPPPGRFSISTGWPSCPDSFSATVRAMMSVALPGVNGTITRSGFAGQAWAHAPHCAASSANAMVHFEKRSIGRLPPRL